MVGVFGVGTGIAQRTTGSGPVNAVDIAVIISGGSGDEGDVDF